MMQLQLVTQRFTRMRGGVPVYKIKVFYGVKFCLHMFFFTFRIKILTFGLYFVEKPSDFVKSNAMILSGLKIDINPNKLKYVTVTNKVIRKNVTVPEWLVKLANREKVNYSEILTQALEKRLQL